ncbi:hypothetical protein [Pelagicoccus sp. SDUM812002]|uniref:hypothetical protein n=1 Tax=Pelagicoccus sp. SDUM812002 TaxID=3041266 RepID=UPI00280F57F0|nr:hypothetical protein [Pelagicoccus sp. SDUM812002]MDQ8184361.1 hypothetical protein [Pelagicoccus sp. SDUM812002]
MLPALSYTSLDEFDDDYLEALIEEAAELSLEHRWWNQAFALKADTQNASLLTGSNKLMHRYLTNADGTTRKIDYRDDVLMGAVDTLTLLEMLTLLSKEHEFAWQVSIPSEPRPKAVGRIIDGEIEPRLFELIMPEVEALEISESELEDETLHQKLRDKYGL